MDPSRNRTETPWNSTTHLSPMPPTLRRTFSPSKAHPTKASNSAAATRPTLTVFVYSPGQILSRKTALRCLWTTRRARTTDSTKPAKERDEPGGRQPPQGHREPPVAETPRRTKLPGAQIGQHPRQDLQVRGLWSHDADLPAHRLAIQESRHLLHPAEHRTDSSLDGGSTTGRLLPCTYGQHL